MEEEEEEWEGGRRRKTQQRKTNDGRVDKTERQRDAGETFRKRVQTDTDSFRSTERYGGSRRGGRRRWRRRSQGGR